MQETLPDEAGDCSGSMVVQPLGHSSRPMTKSTHQAFVHVVCERPKTVRVLFARTGTSRSVIRSIAWQLPAAESSPTLGVIGEVMISIVVCLQIVFVFGLVLNWCHNNPLFFLSNILFILTLDFARRVVCRAVSRRHRGPSYSFFEICVFGIEHLISQENYKRTVFALRRIRNVDRWAIAVHRMYSWLY